MIDFKYHIASLVAIFLALAIGILVGTSLTGTSSVENQIRKLKSGFDRVQAEDRKLRDENTGLRQQAQTLENALRQVAPAAVRGRLPEKRIAVIVGGPIPDASFLREIKYLLSTAGATVSSITTFQGNLMPENPNSRQIITERTGILDTPDRAHWQLAAHVVRDIIQGRAPDTIRLLGQYSPGLGVDGDYTLPVDAVVLLATNGSGEEERAMADGSSIQARIADAIREQGITAVACEQQECPVSLMPYFARYNLATVDGVDTPLGKIALVYALAGKQGHYGTKPSAAQVLPDLDIAPATPDRGSPTHSLLPAPPAPSPQRKLPLPVRGRS